MSMRYCSYGDHHVAEEKFAWKNKAKGKRNSICKPCNSERVKARYKNDPDSYQKIKYRNVAYVQRNAEFVYDWLVSHPCVDCGEDEPLYLEFDHLRDKMATICQLVQRPASLSLIKTEIDKCEVVCVKCHRLRTASRANWYRYQRMTWPDARVEMEQVATL